MRPSVSVLTRRLARTVGIEQAVQVDDKITHVRVIDGLLRFRLPGDIGAGIIRKDADDLDLVEIFELGAAEFGHLAAEHEMEQLFCRYIFGHDMNPWLYPLKKPRRTLCGFSDRSRVCANSCNPGITRTRIA